MLIRIPYLEDEVSYGLESKFYSTVISTANCSNNTTITATPVTITIHKEQIIHELKKTQMANKYLKEKQLTIASSNSTKRRRCEEGKIRYGNSRDNVSNIPF
ncbi:hypothetical protein ACTFIV_000812 [Dictyostelium citrinum]